ncbi:MAG: hypothetical protein RTV31_03375 [Candidatus Thorarchaeota archaeon]
MIIDLVYVFGLVSLMMWRDDMSYIENIFFNLYLIGLGIFCYFFCPWFFSKYGPDEFKDRE